MSKMSSSNSCAVFCLVLALCCLDIVQLIPPPATTTRQKLTDEGMLRIGHHCMAEVGIDQKVILRAMKGRIPKADQKYKDYLTCSYKKQGYLSEDGKTFNYDALYAFLETIDYSKEELLNVDPCKAITAETPGDLCLENLLCILDGLKKVDRLRKSSKQNATSDEVNSV